MSQYDIVIVGGGHAGIEAATISSLLNLKVLLVTFAKDKIGFPSCNPSIGGIGKAILFMNLMFFPVRCRYLRIEVEYILNF